MYLIFNPGFVLLNLVCPDSKYQKFGATVNKSMLKVSNRNIKKRCEICLMLKILKLQNDVIDFLVVSFLSTSDTFYTFF